MASGEHPINNFSSQMYHSNDARGQNSVAYRTSVLLSTKRIHRHVPVQIHRIWTFKVFQTLPWQTLQSARRGDNKQQQWSSNGHQINWQCTVWQGKIEFMVLFLIILFRRYKTHSSLQSTLFAVKESSERSRVARPLLSPSSYQTSHLKWKSSLQK